DEATASVDAAADLLIQSSLKTHFSGVTILSIAHRLATIADFDRVMVLDEGRLAEFDTPYNLLANSRSLYSELADATGPASSAQLRETARVVEERRMMG
ncbi:Multidrug resistance-associated protein 4, partial [Thoreauomyces humboldtii]